MNSNFLLIRIPSKSEIKLRVYRFDLTGFSTKVLGGADPTNQDQSKLEITLEPGRSNRVTVFDKRSYILNIYRLNDDIPVRVDLGLFTIEDSFTFDLAAFLMGKIILIKSAQIKLNVAT